MNIEELEKTKLELEKMKKENDKKIESDDNNESKRIRNFKRYYI